MLNIISFVYSVFTPYALWNYLITKNDRTGHLKNINSNSNTNYFHSNFEWKFIIYLCSSVLHRKNFFLIFSPVYLIQNCIKIFIFQGIVLWGCFSHFYNPNVLIRLFVLMVVSWYSPQAHHDAQCFHRCDSKLQAPAISTTNLPHTDAA